MSTQNTPRDERTPLTFDNDRGSSRSTWIATFILLAIVGWMGSGFFITAEEDETTTSAPSAPAPVAVAVRTSRAEPVTLYFQAEGQALPDRDTALRAETSGDVAEVLISKGQDVEQGAMIARLTTDQAEAELLRATEELERAQRELENSLALLERGVATEDRVVQARAALASAQSGVTSAQQSLEQTAIIAPFSGRIETLTLDAGEYISAGTEVGRIVDNTPLTVSIQVPQQALNLVRNGQTAEVAFITGEVREGRVTFVGTSATSETRTFLAEIEVPNEGGTIPAGISAEIRMPTGERMAHFISPSVVSLSPEGMTGVKTVENNAVVFHEIEVARAEVDGIWVTGLPEEIDLITIGQGFVRDGEAVDARLESIDTAQISDEGASE